YDLTDNSNLELKNMFGQYMKMNITSSLGSRTLLSNTITNPKEDLKGITTRSRIAYKGPTIHTTSSPPKVVERETNVTKDMVPPTNNRSTKDVQPRVVQVETQVPNSKTVVTLVVELVDAPVRASKPNPKSSIPYPSRLNDQKLCKSLLTNKEKLFELARTQLNENCSAVILKSASINLMPLLIWEKLSLLELTPTQMILELVDRSTTRLAGIVEDVFVKVGKFHFLTDFIVVDYVVDPLVPLILGRPFLRTGCALIDVYACEEYSQEVLGFSVSGNPTPSTELIVSTSSPTLTPFGDSDFLFEETDAFLAIEDEPISL
nr:hypothetical protein [Tanacetum cinerariifolium]